MFEDDEDQGQVNDWQTVPSTTGKQTSLSADDWQTVHVSNTPAPTGVKPPFPASKIGPAPKKMSQYEFLSKLKEQSPALKDFSDDDLVDNLLKSRPELSSQVDFFKDIEAKNAAVEKARATIRSRSLIDPDLWKRYPKTGQFLKSTTDALPGIGAIVGGALATPETLGLGTIAGGALGAGAGRGAQDLINQELGLDYTTPGQKMGNIAMDTALAAVTPGVIEGVLHPGTSARIVAGAAAKGVQNIEGLVVPRALRPYVTPGIVETLENFSKGGTPKFVDTFKNYVKGESEHPFVRPSWQTGEQSVGGDIPELIQKSRMSNIANPPPSGPLTQGEFPFMQDEIFNQRPPVAPPSTELPSSVFSDIEGMQRHLPVTGEPRRRIMMGEPFQPPSMEDFANVPSPTPPQTVRPSVIDMPTDPVELAMRKSEGYKTNPNVRGPQGQLQMVRTGPSSPVREAGSDLLESTMRGDTPQLPESWKRLVQEDKAEFDPMTMFRNMGRLVKGEPLEIGSAERSLAPRVVEPEVIPFADKPAEVPEAFRSNTEWDRSVRNSALYEGRNINDIRAPLTREQQLIKDSYERIRNFENEYSAWFSEQENKLPEHQFFKPPAEIENQHRAIVEQLKAEHEALVNRLTGGLEKAPPPDINVPKSQSLSKKWWE